MMWPGPGNDYEASPYSPAGRAQTSWWFFRRYGRTRSGRWVMRLLAVALVWGVIVRPLVEVVRAAF
jgi:hypothetical protein